MPLMSIMKAAKAMNPTAQALVVSVAAVDVYPVVTSLLLVPMADTPLCVLPAVRARADGVAQPVLPFPQRVLALLHEAPGLVLRVPSPSASRKQVCSLGSPSFQPCR